MKKLEWDQLQSLAHRLSGNGVGPGGILDNEWITIEQALNLLIESKSWEDVIKLRETFSFLINGETTGGMPVIMKLNDVSIIAAEKMGNKSLLAQYLHDNAENYHRKGYHKESVRDFERAALLYKQENESRKSLESYYFSALAYRGLGERKHALEILEEVLKQLDPNDPWRANPLEVLSWIYRDDGKFSLAEQTLRTALELFQKLEGLNNIHAVQVLNDLGEVISRQGRFDDAEKAFHQSLVMIEDFQGQYNRQEARIMIKYAEMLNIKKEYDHALNLLNKADDKIRGYGHYYESMLKIEVTRSIAYLGLRRWGSAYRKFKLATYFCNEIDLPFIQLVKFLVQGIILQLFPPHDQI